MKTIKDATTDPRSFEKALREAGLSKSAAEYVVSLCKNSLGEPGRDVKDEPLDDLFAGLRKLNAELAVRNVFNFKE